MPLAGAAQDGAVKPTMPCHGNVWGVASIPVEPILSGRNPSDSGHGVTDSMAAIRVFRAMQCHQAGGWGCSSALGSPSFSSAFALWEARPNMGWLSIQADLIHGFQLAWQGGEAGSVAQIQMYSGSRLEADMWRELTNSGNNI